MPRIDIHTVLGFAPPERKHEILVITRGSTASIIYNLYDKVYDMDNIDQLTFLFKQGKKLLSFNLVDYFAPTKDLEIDEDKNYYRKKEDSLIDNDELFELIDTIEGGSVAAYRKKYGEVYEITDLADGEVSENWQFNKHFTYEHGNGYSYLTFMLSANETLLFKPTVPENNVMFEVATRLNTDSLEGMHNMDSVIISKQHSIAVVDSLYSSLLQMPNSMEENTNVAIVSEKTYCSESLYCKN